MQKVWTCYQRIWIYSKHNISIQIHIQRDIYITCSDFRMIKKRKEQNPPRGAIAFSDGTLYTYSIWKFIFRRQYRFKSSLSQCSMTNFSSTRCSNPPNLTNRWWRKWVLFILWKANAQQLVTLTINFLFWKVAKFYNYTNN